MPNSTSWTFTAPPFTESLQQIKTEFPDSPAKGQVFIEVHAAALNPVDVQFGNLPIFKLPWLQWPKNVGADVSGKVIAVGEGVDELQRGDEVFGLTFKPLCPPQAGALSKIQAVDAASSVLVKKPASLSWTDAASLPLVWLTALTTLNAPYTLLPPPSTEGKAAPPAVVILGGSSSVGVYCVQYAVKMLGLRVIATCSSRNAAFVRDTLGASEVIDYTSEDIAARLKELKPVDGYASIIDCVGGTELFGTVPGLLTPRSDNFKSGGAYVTIVGDKTSRASMGGPLTYYWTPAQVMRHFWGWWGSGFRYYNVQLEQRKDYLAEACDALEQGKLEVIVDSTFAFDDVPKAYERLNSARARGKVVVSVKED